MSLELESRALARTLKKKKARIVFAESCTGGQLGSVLTEIPGISEFFCGSLVTYRDDSKTRWLGVSKALLERKGAVSPEVALAMARGALKRTPEATIAAAITGHLGPKAPRGLDGKIYCAVATRSVFEIQELQLGTARGSQESLRRERRKMASLSLFLMVRSLLEASH